MKSSFISTFAIFAALLFGIGSLGCKCKKTCENGSCSGSNCICNGGWEGDNCDVETRARFLGNFSVKHFCDSGYSTLTASVTSEPDNVMMFRLGNFYNTGSEAVVTLKSDNSFNLLEQVVGGITLRGSGSINLALDTIQVNYSAISVVPPDSCIDLWLRQ